MEGLIRFDPGWYWLRILRRLYGYRAFRKAYQLVHPYRAPDRWVFVLGCYNSGTTLLQRLLSHHPEVSTLPFEGVRLTGELPRPEDFGWTRMWCRCEDRVALPASEDVETAERVKRDWGAFLDRDASVYLEKSISNLLRVDWLARHFESARFVGIVRNPYAVAEGIRRKAVPRPPVLHEVGRQYPIRWAAEQWVRAKEIMDDQSSDQQNLLCIRYEDLVEDPTTTLELVFGFLDLDAPSMEFRRNRLTVGSSSECLINMNPRSLSRLSPSDLREVSEIAGPELARLGYELLGSP